MNNEKVLDTRGLRQHGSFTCVYHVPRRPPLWLASYSASDDEDTHSDLQEVKF